MTGIFGVHQQPCRLRHRAGIALRVGDLRKLGDAQLGVFGNRVFLHRRIGDDHHRSRRRRHHDLVGAHARFGEMLERGRIVVPFHVVAHDRGGVLHGVVPFDAGPPHGGVEDIADHHVDGNAVAPGIVEGHGGMLQPDGAVREHAQRLALDLEIAVAHGDRNFLVGAGEEFRALVAAVVDQRLVQAAKARRRIGGHVFEAERLDHVDHEIAAALAEGERLQRGRRGGLGRFVGQRHRISRRRRLGGGLARSRQGRGPGQRRALQELATLLIRHSRLAWTWRSLLDVFPTTGAAGAARLAPVARFHSDGHGRHSAMPRPMIHAMSSGDKNFISSVNSVTACR